MKMKKVLALVLAFALTVTATIGGTVAYLTKDMGEENNVFTMGKIDVTLDEEVGVYGEGGEAKKVEDGAEYVEVMPGDYLKKKVTVSNTGMKDAYVAVTVKLNNADKINAAIDDVYEKAPYNYTAEQIQNIYNEVFDGWHINYNPRPGAEGIDDARGVIDGVFGLPEYVLKVDFAKTIKGSTVIGATNWFVAGREKAGQYWVDGPNAYDGYYTADMNDYEICYTYYMLLPAGEKTTLFNGLNVPAEFTEEQMAMFENLEINVSAAAIQADNMGVAEIYKNDAKFGEAKTAFAVLAGDIKAEDLNVNNKPSGKMGVTYTSADRYWGEHSSNAKVSHVIKFYNDDTYMGETSLNNIGGIIDGDVNVTWSLKLAATSSSDSYWSMKWEKAPTTEMMPNRTELWVDGEKVDEGKIQLNAPDNLNPIVGMVTDAEGKILRFVVKGTEPNLAAGETYVAFISNNAELDKAIKDGTTTVILMPGTYIVPDSAQRKTVRFIGTGETIIATQDDGSYEGCDYSLDGATATFENVTINTDSRTYTGYARMKGTYKNCTINGTYTLYDESVFENCTFNVTGDVYNIWTWGAPTATFTNCTFNSDGKAVLLYGTANTKLTVNDCVFNDNGGLTDLKAAIEIGNDYNKSYELIVNNTTVNGYEINDKGINTGTTLWANKNSMGTDKLNVVVDGVDVY
ncbi:MAG: hypothetical protein IJN69_03620 [Oscillospiraceae bacterium]|nr:hypothetical protein [Oscillospiraceae bacterium]